MEFTMSNEKVIRENRKEYGQKIYRMLSGLHFFRILDISCLNLVPIPISGIIIGAEYFTSSFYEFLMHEFVALQADL